MAWRFNDLTLGVGSAVETVQSGPQEVSLSLAVTPDERRQLQEMARYAGQLEEVRLPGGGVLVLDTSPDGRNTVYVEPDALNLFEAGWYCWAEVLDDYRGSVTVNRMQVSLKRIAGPDARGITRATAHHVAEDFSISDAEALVGLPVGASNPRKADGGLVAVRYVPVGENLLANGGFETDVASWTGMAGGTVTRDTGFFKVGAASAKVQRGSSQIAALSEIVSVEPGAAYAVSGHIRGGTGGGQFAIQWYDENDVNLGNVGETGNSASEWVARLVAGVAPPKATRARVRLGITTGSHNAYFDAVMFQRCVPVAVSAVAAPAAEEYAGASLRYETAPKAHHQGDVRVYDMGAETDATLAGSAYTRVYDVRHRFVGDVLVDNGVLRIRFTAGLAALLAGSASEIRAHVLVDDAWQPEFRVGLDTGGNGGGTSSTIISAGLRSVSGSRVTVNTVDSDGNRASLTVQRGLHAVRVDTVRVTSVTAGRQDIQSGSARRFSVYNEGQVLKDFAVTTAYTEVSGASVTAPYFLAVDPTVPYLFAIGFSKKPPQVLFHGSVGELVWRSNTATTAADKRTYWLILIPWPAMTSARMYAEAEGLTKIGPTPGFTVADAAASGGQAVQCNAHSDGVRITIDRGVDIPLGEYTIVARVRDTAAATNGTRIVFQGTSYNSTAGTTYGFITADVSITSSGAANVDIGKNGSAAGSVFIDYVLLIPRKRNSATPSTVFFPGDVARDAVIDVDSQSGVVEA